MVCRGGWEALAASRQGLERASARCGGLVVGVFGSMCRVRWAIQLGTGHCIIHCWTASGMAGRRHSHRFVRVGSTHLSCQKMGSRASKTPGSLVNGTSKTSRHVGAAHASWLLLARVSAPGRLPMRRLARWLQDNSGPGTAPRVRRNGSRPWQSRRYLDLVGGEAGG